MSSEATLAGHLDSLREGSVLIFESVPEDGPRFAHTVRLCSEPRLGVDPLFGMPITQIEWYDEDALPEAMAVRRKGSSAAVTVVLGNVVLADHGHRVEPLPLPSVGSEPTYRPSLPDRPLTFACPYDEAEPGRSACATMRGRAEDALAQVTADRK